MILPGLRPRIELCWVMLFACFCLSSLFDVDKKIISFFIAFLDARLKNLTTLLVGFQPLIDGFLFLCKVNPLTIYLTIDTV